MFFLKTCMILYHTHIYILCTCTVHVSSCAFTFSWEFSLNYGKIYFFVFYTYFNSSNAKKIIHKVERAGYLLCARNRVKFCVCKKYMWYVGIGDNLRTNIIRSVQKFVYSSLFLPAAVESSFFGEGCSVAPAAVAADALSATSIGLSTGALQSTHELLSFNQ